MIFSQTQPFPDNVNPFEEIDTQNKHFQVKS